MVGQGARKWSVAGCQGWKHSQPCLKPRHAPSTGAEKGWVKGIKKKTQNNQEKTAHRETQRSRLDGGFIIQCLCWTERSKTPSRKAVLYQGGVICLVQVSQGWVDLMDVELKVSGLFHLLHHPCSSRWNGSCMFFFFLLQASIIMPRTQFPRLGWLCWAVVVQGCVFNKALLLREKSSTGSFPPHYKDNANRTPKCYRPIVFTSGKRGKSCWFWLDIVGGGSGILE